MRIALEHNVLSPQDTFFDFGCGYGTDSQFLRAQGYEASGWDPYFQPDARRRHADVVGLVYVINVIESVEEREEALAEAWALADRVLVVAAQVIVESRTSSGIPYSDGILTNRDTFQKYYEQEELREYILSTLGVEPVAAGIGVFLVFRDPAEAETYLAARARRRLTRPSISRASERFEELQELLEPLMDFFTERGRLPWADEFDGSAELRERGGSLKRCWRLVREVTGAEQWDSISQARAQDLLIYLALSRFSQRRPKLSGLPMVLQRDVRAQFSTYKRACELADDLLFSIGGAGAVEAACRRSPVGKLLPGALYVHVGALGELEPVLRVYEGCARRYVGQVDGATLVKFHLGRPEISYLFYPDFDTDPHPALQASVEVSLRKLRARFLDYREYTNPPVLHRKETFVTPSYPAYEKFSRLTRQEDKWGLLDQPRSIGTRDGWNKVLARYGMRTRGHRLVRTR